MASAGQVKVVIIDTRYIVTDPMSFKSVVQSLTGKDASTGDAKKRRVTPGGGNHGTIGVEDSSINMAANGGGDPRLLKGSSFKDLDRMMLELPPVEEWGQLWANYNLY